MKNIHFIPEKLNLTSYNNYFSRGTSFLSTDSQLYLDHSDTSRTVVSIDNNPSSHWYLKSLNLEHYDEKVQNIELTNMITGITIKIFENNISNITKNLYNGKLLGSYLVGLSLDQKQYTLISLDSAEHQFAKEIQNRIQDTKESSPKNTGFHLWRQYTEDLYREKHLVVYSNTINYSTDKRNYDLVEILDKKKNYIGIINDNTLIIKDAPHSFILRNLTNIKKSLFVRDTIRKDVQLTIPRNTIDKYRDILNIDFSSLEHNLNILPEEINDSNVVYKKIQSSKFRDVMIKKNKYFCRFVFCHLDRQYDVVGFIRNNILYYTNVLEFNLEYQPNSAKVATLDVLDMDSLLYTNVQLYSLFIKYQDKETQVAAY